MPPARDPWAAAAKWLVPLLVSVILAGLGFFFTSWAEMNRNMITRDEWNAMRQDIADTKAAVEVLHSGEGR